MLHDTEYGGYRGDGLGSPRVAGSAGVAAAVATRRQRVEDPNPIGTCGRSQKLVRTASGSGNRARSAVRATRSLSGRARRCFNTDERGEQVPGYARSARLNRLAFVMISPAWHRPSEAHWLARPAKSAMFSVTTQPILPAAHMRADPRLGIRLAARFRRGTATMSGPARPAWREWPGRASSIQQQLDLPAGACCRRHDASAASASRARSTSAASISAVNSA